MNFEAETMATTPDTVAGKGAGGSRASAVLKQGIGILLAAVCVGFAFKGIDIAKLWASIQKVNVQFVLALVASTLISHWLRALRWVITLKPLSSNKISVGNAFAAIMYGYAVNIPIPRGGEVARVVAISKSESIPWVGVLPTMLIDRLLDIAMLVGLVGLTLSLLPADLKQNVGYLVPAGIAMCVATVVGLALLPKAADIIRAITALPPIKERLPEKLQATLSTLAAQVEAGTRSLSSPVNLLFIGLLSLAIWSAYFCNLYLTLQAFGLAEKLDFPRSIIVFTIGSVSVIAPTPGCVGTYHVALSQALNMVAGIERTQALALTTLLHAISFVIVPVATAAFCFLLQNLRAPKDSSKV